MIPLLALALEAVPALVQLWQGDKAAQVTEKVISAAKIITGCDEAPDALDSLKKNPDLYAQFKLSIMNIELERSKAELADTQDARAMLVKTNSNVPAILTFLVVTLYAIALFGVALGEMVVSDKHIGDLWTLVYGAFTFWIGVHTPVRSN